MKPFNRYEIIPSNDAYPSVDSSRTGALAFQEHNYTWEQVIRVLRKHGRFSAFVAIALTGTVFLYARMQKDFYKPTARLEIAPPGSGINTLHEIDSAVEAADNQDYLETQVQILRSDALAVSVIRELHLDKNPEFASTRQAPPPPETTSITVSIPNPEELAILQEQLDLATLSAAEFAALGRFQRNLSVSSVRNTRLVEISFSSHDPRMAQLIANTLVTKFIDQNYKHRYTSTMQASEWLSSQLSDLRKKVEQSTQAVSDYQKKYGLVDVDDRDVPVAGLMNEVNRQLSEAQASRIESEAFVRMIDDGHADAVPALRDDKLYQDLLARYGELRTQLAQAKTVYGDDNINVKKLQDEISEVSVQIDAERNRAIGRARSAYSASMNREALMAGEQENLRAKMGHMSSQLTAYHLLKAEANANAELYNTLQARLREAGIYAGLRSSNIRVVDLASNLGIPTGPHRVLLVTLGAFASCLIAVMLSFVRESFRNTVHTPEDVRSWIGLPSLALVPAISRAKKTITLLPDTDAEFGSPFRATTRLNGRRPGAGISLMTPPTVESEAMRDLRTALVNANAWDKPGVILISSAMEGEGKTTVAVNFSLALAELGSTCLVEADLRQPTVANVFNIEQKAGLADVLNGAISLPDALTHVPGFRDLEVLPCGSIPESPADVLSLPLMNEILETMRAQFDYVVIDSPPVIRFCDARFLSSLADKVVLVGRHGVTTRRAMQRAIELLKDAHASIAGVVLNEVDLSSPDYHYYSYGYSSWKPKRPANGRVAPKTDGDNKPPRAMGASA